MRSKHTALLLYEHPDGFFETAGAILETLSVRTIRAQRCKQAADFLAMGSPPHVVLTDTTLFDSTWEGVVDLARKAATRVNVVVVSRVADLPLYLDVMSEGAFDFVTHAFTIPELVHVFRCALDDAARFRASKGELVRHMEVQNPVEPTPTA